jgi:hypothetical protein
VPERWSDTDGSPYTDSFDVEFAALAASANLESFFGDWAESGVELRATTDTTQYTVENLLANAAVDAKLDCSLQETGPYDRDGITGQYAYYTGCGDAGSSFAAVVGSPAGGAASVALTAVILSEQDTADWSHVLASLRLAG